MAGSADVAELDEVYPACVADWCARLFPARVPGGAGGTAVVVELGSGGERGVALGETGWQPGRAPTWARSLWLHLRVRADDGGGEEASRSAPTWVRIASLPWPCDAFAHRDAPAGVRPPAEGRLFIGRPMVALRQQRPRPGLHLVDRDAARRGPMLLLRPDVGPAVGLRGAREQGALVVEAPRRGRRTVRIDDLAKVVEEQPRRLSPHERLLAEAFDLEGLGGSGRFLWSQHALDRGVRVLGTLRGSPSGCPLGPADLHRAIEFLEGASCDGLRSELDLDAVAELRGYAALTLEAMIAGLAEGLGQLSDARRSSTVTSLARGQQPSQSALSAALAPLSAAVSRRIRALWDPVGVNASMVVAEATTNRLAEIERSRTVTLFGPGGLSHPWRGSAALRDTHPSALGRLCPLHTRESEDIGLVRFLADGAQAGADPVAVDSSGGHLSASARLIPFFGHNDPARGLIAAKTLKQALPIAEAAPPIVETGAEAQLAEQGVVRAADDGMVRSTLPLEVEERGRQRRVYPIERLGIDESRVDNRWRLLVEEGEQVTTGQLLASAPDVVNHADGAPRLCLGRDCLVAFTPWYGWNVEDAIVVGSDLAQPFTSRHVLPVEERLGTREVVARVPDVGNVVGAGELLARVRTADNGQREVRSPAAGEVAYVSEEPGSLTVHLRVELPLSVGDKLTTRHGGKGVVGRVVPAERMPRVPALDRRVEAIINPVGIARRLNIGTLAEAHAGLLALLGATARASSGWRLGSDGLTRLREDLAEAGAPGGRLALELDDGTELSDVVVGPQYLLKLDHLAARKLQARGHGPRARRAPQPARGARWSAGVRIGGAQRLGEMEMWALQAVGADELATDALRARAESSDEPGKLDGTLVSVLRHLRAANVGTTLETHDGTEVDVCDDKALEGLHPRELAGLRHYLTVGPDRAPSEADAWSGVELLAPDDIHRPEVDFERGGPDDPLYRPDWFGQPASPSCPCGAVTEAGAVCWTCEGVARRRASPQRRRLRWAIALPEAVPHPWWTAAETVALDSSGDGAVEEVADAPGHGELFAESGHGPGTSIEAVPVLPPAYRSPEDGINAAYRELARAARRLEALLEWAGDGADDIPMVADARAHLAAAVIEVIGRPGDGPAAGTISGRLNGKQGLLRRGLLGRTTDWSARAVLTPDPDLGPEQVGVPRAVWSRLGLPEQAAGSDSDLGRVVVLNRQPTLHPYNLVALQAQPVDDDTIHLPPLLCKAIAGDFDGDEATLHRPRGAGARADAWQRLRPAHNLRSSADGGLLATLGQEISIGLHRAAAEAGGWRALACGHGAADTGESVSSPAELAERCVDTASDPATALQRLWKLQRSGFSAAVGWSLSLAELRAVDRDRVAEHTRELANGRASADAVAHRLLADVGEVRAYGGLGEAVAAGAAGPDSGHVQLLGARGPVARFDPRIDRDDPPFITGCYALGLEPAEHAAAAPAALRNIGDKKLLSPETGGLTKRLAEIAEDVVVSGEDCAWQPRPEWLPSTPDPVGTGRSPVACRWPYPCQQCYGPDPATGDPPPVGRRVGLLAALLIGERSTQQSMRSFWGGGAERTLERQVVELKGFFGQGTFTLPGEHEPTRLAAVAAEGEPQRIDRLLECFDELTGGSVARVHAAVVLRRLIDTERAGQHLDRWSLGRSAESRGLALLEACARGDLTRVLAEVTGRSGNVESLPGRRKAAVVTGDVDAANPLTPPRSQA